MTEDEIEDRRKDILAAQHALDLQFAAMQAAINERMQNMEAERISILKQIENARIGLHADKMRTIAEIQEFILAKYGVEFEYVGDSTPPNKLN